MILVNNSNKILESPIISTILINVVIVINSELDG